MRVTVSVSPVDWLITSTVIVPAPIMSASVTDKTAGSPEVVRLIDTVPSVPPTVSVAVIASATPAPLAASL